MATGMVSAGLAFALAGCGPGGTGADESARRLIDAAVRGDRVAFEAQIDRDAVREDLRRQVVELARTDALDVEGGPSDLALDRMISPDAVRVVRAGSGERLRVAPSSGQIEPLMKVVDKKHVCLADADTQDHCLLTFAKGGGHWRLVGMQAMDVEIEVAGD